MKDAQSIKNPFKVAKSISEEVFNRWHQGDEDARGVAMEWSFHCFWYIAVHQLRDEDKADDVLQDTFFELDRLVRNGKIEWRGAVKFESYARQRLLWRITDRKRGGLGRSFMSLFEPVDGEDEELTLLDVLPSAEASPEIIAEQREAITIIIKGVLLSLREHLKSTKQRALVEVVEAMIEYVIKRLWETLPSDCPPSQTLDELLELFDTEAVEFSKRECYEFIMRHLDISRNVLDQRLKRLRPIMRDWLKKVFRDKI
jgi:DNA-directed RNA polymerase specialized sigma24 family protein